MAKTALLLFLLLVSCQPSEDRVVFTGNAMTIDYKVIVGHKLSKKKQREVEDLIVETFEEIDRIHNRWNPASELSLLNRLPPHTPVPVSKELEDLLQLTDEIVSLTEGRFDPTVEPLRILWKKHLEKETLPNTSEIASVAESVGWNKIHFKEGTFYKDAHCMLDLGGIAKGYAVDLITERLREKGHADVFVEWGGEIRAQGNHPENRPWTIFISRLGSPSVEEAVALLPLHDQAIATSGDYLQNWTVDGKCYCHIIDPHTHHPLLMTEKSISSVSILTDSCAFADGLATAGMLFPNKKTAEIWLNHLQETYPEMQFWMQTTDDFEGRL